MQHFEPKYTIVMMLDQSIQAAYLSWILQPMMLIIDNLHLSYRRSFLTSNNNTKALSTYLDSFLPSVVVVVAEHTQVGEAVDSSLAVVVDLAGSNHAVEDMVPADNYLDSLLALFRCNPFSCFYLRGN